jgi:HD-GYP domain protein
MGVHGNALQDLTACALLHDNALTQYIQEEFHGRAESLQLLSEIPHLGLHCSQGEENIRALPFSTDVSGVILYHHENADGSGPFGKSWREVPLFARIIHLCDLLDAFCRANKFTPEVWNRAEDFLSRVRGKIFDDECSDAFLHAFPEEHFLSLGGDDLEARLWSKVPREKQELSFPQIKALADFFAKIVDYKSPFTSTHSIGVASCAERLSRFMGFDEETAQKMYLAGALHDIGKVAVGNEILENPGRLTDEEFAVMKHHAAYTYQILSDIEDFNELRDWAAFHHERLDGTGYPFRKTAPELNTQERIMACVDIYQALTESRPYKPGMSHEKACAILRDMAGKGWLDAGITEKADLCFGEGSR